MLIRNQPYWVLVGDRWPARLSMRNVDCLWYWWMWKVCRWAFIGGGRSSGKQLVYKKSKRNPKKIEALHGASLPREFERQDMAKLFNKKIKTRFPILLNEHWIFIWWKQGEDCEKSSVAKQIHLKETKFQIIRNATEEVWFNDGRGFS